MDVLLAAAQRLGIPTDASACADARAGIQQQAWASWPRHRLELAHDVLRRALELDDRAGVELGEAGRVWHAYCGDWDFRGNFEEAVAKVALRVCEGRRAPGIVRPARAR